MQSIKVINKHFNQNSIKSEDQSLNKNIENDLKWEQKFDIIEDRNLKMFSQMPEIMRDCFHARHNFLQISESYLRNTQKFKIDWNKSPMIRLSPFEKTWFDRNSQYNLKQVSSVPYSLQSYPLKPPSNTYQNFMLHKRYSSSYLRNAMDRKIL